jgi:RHS repeat-associated protein
MSNVSNGQTVTNLWTYDTRGHVTSETVNAGIAYTTQWDYNSADLPKWMKYPDDETVNYTYNDRMLLDSVIGTSVIGTTVYVSSTTYDAAGRIDLRTFGNTTQAAYVYYPWTAQDGRLRELKSGTSGNPASLQNVTYTYDAAGNISTILDSNAGPQLQSFSYDVLNRLQSAAATGGANGRYDETYQYDSASGNLINNGSLTLSYTNSSHVHAVTSAGSNTYSYDPNGNMICRTENGTKYKQDYNFENQLIRVQTMADVGCTGTATTVASFIYDGDGKRVKATMDGTTTTFVGNYYEVTDTGAVTKYYYAGTQLVARRKYTIPQPMTVEYFLSDHLGSTSLTTNSDGGKVSEIRYRPWGEIRYSWKSDTNMPAAYKLSSYTFTGQYSYMDDPTTQPTEGIRLMYYNARFYSPCIMQFSQPDTVIPELYNPQSLNRYSYVDNNPIRYNDPTGHMRVADQDMSRNNVRMSCREHPEYCNNGKPKSPDELAKMRHKNTEEQSISDKILANKYTPIGAAAVQVLSGTVMSVATPFVETPVGLGVWIGAFAVNRGSSLLGLASTFYQYKKNLYGTNFTDVVVNGTAFTFGWIPSLTEGLSIGTLVYSGIRLDHEAPINIPAPDFLK